MDVPIAALRPSTLAVLSTLLNPSKVIPTETGLPRDWRGLAELVGLNSELIASIRSQPDPTAAVLQALFRLEDAQCKTFKDLTAFLGVLDRFDVVQDAEPLLVSDANAYKEARKNGVDYIPAQNVLDVALDRNILTVDDSQRAHQNLPPTRYDAFILYAEEDSDFAHQVVEKLENEYKLKVCVKDRDLLPGVMFEHEVIGRLIEERCNRFLVILSPNFLKSSANQFLVSYAQASALESRSRKIIPCIYQQCERPPSVRHLFCIDFSRASRLYNVWDKLSDSIKSPPRSRPTGETHLTQQLPNSSLALTDESFKWWDADKDTSKTMKERENQPSTPPPSYSKTQLKINGASGSIDDSADTLSISSNAKLLSSKSGKKWYDKITKQIKKKDKAPQPPKQAVLE